MVCLGNLWLSKVVQAKEIWCGGESRRRKDGVPRKLVAQ